MRWTAHHAAIELSEEGMTGLVQTTLIIELMALPDNSSEDDSADIQGAQQTLI